MKDKIRQIFNGLKEGEPYFSNDSITLAVQRCIVLNNLISLIEFPLREVKQ